MCRNRPFKAEKMKSVYEQVRKLLRVKKLTSFFVYPDILRLRIV